MIVETLLKEGDWHSVLTQPKHLHVSSEFDIYAHLLASFLSQAWKFNFNLNLSYVTKILLFIAETWF